MNNIPLYDHCYVILVISSRLYPNQCLEFYFDLRLLERLYEETYQSWSDTLSTKTILRLLDIFMSLANLI